MVEPSAMKRSAGVTAAAIVMLLYGLAGFVAAVSLPVIISTHTYPTPPVMWVLRRTARAMSTETIVGIGFFVTSYGIFRLRPWARISALSLSVGMIGFGAYLWLSAYLLLPHHGSYWHQSFGETWLDMTLSIFMTLAIPGIWWIALLTQPSVATQFARSVPVFAQPTPGQEPENSA